MSPSYKLGYLADVVLRFAVAVVLIGIAPILMFWAYVVACLVWLLRRSRATTA
jgi:hypothetical protein